MKKFHIVIHNIENFIYQFIINSLCRRMFPTIRVKFSGLDEDVNYVVLLEMVPSDETRYRYSYQKSGWSPAAKLARLKPTNELIASAREESGIYIHPSSPISGSQLNKFSIAFDKLKLTNNPHDKNGYVRFMLYSVKYMYITLHVNLQTSMYISYKFKFLAKVCRLNILSNYLFNWLKILKYFFEILIFKRGRSFVKNSINFEQY